MVGLDAIVPMIEQETMMHVVSLCDHPIRLKDWGFIESDGTFYSLVLAGETMALRDDEVESRGTPQLVERNATFEMGYVRPQRPLGAYAISVTQTRPRIYFNNATPYWRRIWIKLRLWLYPCYFEW